MTTGGKGWPFNLGPEEQERVRRLNTEHAFNESETIDDLIGEFRTKKSAGQRVIEAVSTALVIAVGAAVTLLVGAIVVGAIKLLLWVAAL